MSADFGFSALAEGTWTVPHKGATMAVDTTQILADMQQIHADFYTTFDGVPLGDAAGQFESDYNQLISDINTATNIANNPPAGF